MEGKNPQKSIFESKIFKIPIEEYEIDIETGSAKQKKNEILDLLKNYNKLRSKEEFEEIKYKLHVACIKGDLALIKIYLSETIENTSYGLRFKIDKTNRTASLFKIDKYIEEIIIPRTVKYESIEYLITSISFTSDRLKTLKFVEDSAVEIIYGFAFPFLSIIKEIYFPASLKELKEGWCNNTDHLTKISISPFNGQFKIEEGKYLIGKSDSNKDEFDNLLFGYRDIKEISIPSHIKIISSYAFQCCFNLTKIEILPNSNLQIIGKFAFYQTKIKEIYFPASLMELNRNWCSKIRYLTKITISPFNGQFKIEEGKYLIGKSDSNKDEFDNLLFGCRDIKEISIPSNIKIISSYAFECCYNLIKVEIPPNSNLHTIESNAFSESKIKEIFIPPKVSKICQYAFNSCTNLTKVEIPPNSNLHTIESSAFSGSKIEEIFIPPKVSKICEGEFHHCSNLQIVEISEESKLESFPLTAFAKNARCIIMIPTSLEKLIHTNEPI